VMDRSCIEFSLVEAVPGTSADKPSMAVVPDVFDPEDVAVVDASVVVQTAAVVRARVVSDYNLRVGDGIEARWEQVVVAEDWDLDVANRDYLLPQTRDEVSSVASPLPLQLLHMEMAKMHQS